MPRKKGKKDDGPHRRAGRAHDRRQGRDHDLPRDHDHARGRATARCSSPAARGRSSRCWSRRARTSRPGQPLARLDDTEAQHRGRARRGDRSIRPQRDAERGSQLQGQGLNSAAGDGRPRAQAARTAKQKLAQAQYDLVADAHRRAVRGPRHRAHDQPRRDGDARAASASASRTSIRCWRASTSPSASWRGCTSARPRRSTLDAHARPRRSPARVTLVNPVVDRANGTFKVTLEVPRPGGRCCGPAASRACGCAPAAFDDALCCRSARARQRGRRARTCSSPRGDTVIRVPVTVGRDLGRHRADPRRARRRATASSRSARAASSRARASRPSAF